MQRRDNLLIKLGVDLSDVQGLSEEALQTKVRKQWQREAVRLHPDKNKGPNATAVFQDLLAVYEELRQILVGKGAGENQEVFLRDIDRYFKAKKINIPDTAFNIILMENIEKAYAELLKDFSSLTDEESKKAFVAHYEPFLNLAQTLEGEAHFFYRKLADYLVEQEEERFSKKGFIREWRLAVIRIYGEEYLDDFAYRHALAHGGLYAVLAMRKLLSPFKLVAIIVHLINLLAERIIFPALAELVSPATDFVENSVIRMIKFFRGARDVQRGDRVIAAAIAGMAVGMAVGMTLVLLGTVVPELLLLPIIIQLSQVTAPLMRYLAAPVNNIVRPLADYLGVSPVALSALFVVAGGAGLYATFTAGLAWSVTVMMYLTTLTLIYQTIALAQLTLAIYKENKLFGLMMGVLTGLTTLGNIFTDYTPTSMAYWATMFTLNLALCVILFDTNYLLTHIKAEQEKLLEQLPLPTGPVPDDIKHATWLGSKRASMSHGLFNTPKDAEHIEGNKRTWYQQGSSFFGGGALKNNAKPRFTAKPAMPARLGLGLALASS